jgi:hypothetical protein
MRAKIGLLILFASLFRTGSAQSFTKKDLRSLHSIIAIYLGDQENLRDRISPSEYVVCYLNIDSFGKVNKIHLLADESNRDSIYNYLHRMTPALFKEFKSDSCKNKTIMLPVISIGNGESPEYMINIIAFYPIKQVIVESETKKMVIVSPLHYYVPPGSRHRITNATEK